MPALYTIGHSNHSIEAFVELLHRHDIDAVADVRSQPYSRRHPQFRRDALGASLAHARIEYVFLGRELGARSDDPECWVDGRVDFARLSRTDAFQAGLDAVAEHAAQQRVAIMCAEKDPLTCHRTILVCRALELRSAPTSENGGADPWTIRHVLADGRLESHENAEQRLLDELGVAPDLLRTRRDAVADAYRLRGQRIAWSKR